MGHPTHQLGLIPPPPPLGLGHLLGVAFTEETFPFGVGDVLILYTDGVIEARDSGTSSRRRSAA